MNGVRKGFTFVLLQVALQLSQHVLLKRQFFPLNSLGTVTDNQLTVDVYIGLFLDSQFCSTDLRVCPYGSSILLITAALY